jgi:thiol peroxidase
MKVNHIIFTILSILLAVAFWALLTLEWKGNSMERTGIVTFKGNGLTLVGQEVKVGQKAPDFEVADNKLGAVKFSDFKGSVCIITSVPSLDTPVCDTETRRFNEEASKLGANVKVLTISMDLPFAQARWCGAAGIKNLTTLSDYKTGDFGNAYGVLIKELKLLARAIFIVDGQGIVRYVQIVPEIASEPNYDDVIANVKKLTK